MKKIKIGKFTIKLGDDSMEAQIKWTAMYASLDEGDVINTDPIQLGGHEIKPGDKIVKIGSKKRSSFEMQEGQHLRYVGQVDDCILFKNDVLDEGPNYYAFMYVDSTTLLIGSDKGCMDIRADQVIFSNSHDIVTEDQAYGNDCRGGVCD